jgi:aminoglycoside phosphotransferase family enzyme
MPNDLAEGKRKVTPLDAKIAFLSDPASYEHALGEVVALETHMSWVFLAGERVYKLKKPLRTPILDFSTRQRRERACRDELRLNRRLARRTYLDVVSLTLSGDGLRIGGAGTVADWLVVMRRLDRSLMLDALISAGQLTGPDVERLATVLARFYRQAKPARLAPEQILAGWQKDLALNRKILLDAKLRLPAGLIRRIDIRQRRFLAKRKALLTRRCQARLVVEAHGDLRPEHIWLGKPLQIIDCLEFNERLRTVDALSEIAFLDLECQRRGAAWAGRMLQRGIFARLPQLRSEPLFRFYRSYHATVRARLAVAHLLEPLPRHPEKWRPLALSYLQLAAEDARRCRAASEDQEIG